MRRYNNRKDLVADEMKAELAAHGVVSFDTDLCLGVDHLCGHRGIFFTLELKSHGGTETPRQQRWRKRCESLGLPHFVWREGEPISKILDQIK